MADRRKVILDTDPGIDDILAIMLANASPEFEFLGVTTVAGNVRVHEGTNNALAARRTIEADHLPVCAGCHRPLTRRLRTQADIYGKDEDIGIGFDPNWRQQADPRHAVNFLLEQVAKYPGEITLFPLAPLTNLAAAIVMDPTFAPNVKEIFMMGGATVVRGNTSPAAEFNLWVDPEAARVVFEAGIPITMIGLDVTGKTALWPEDREELDRLDTPVARFIRRITRHYLDRPTPCYLYDPLAVAVGLRPALVTQSALVRVDIETAGEFSHGMSVADLKGRSGRTPNVNVCLEVDSEAFRQLFWERVVHYRK
jgi:inosine-uridine nucleoside N-ribohydrolase